MLLRIPVQTCLPLNSTNNACSNELKHGSEQALLSQNNLNCVPSIPTLHAFPSYSRKPSLFGHVVSDLHEA